MTAVRLLDGQLPTSTVEPERFTRCRGVTTAFGEAAGAKPALIVIDDAHAAPSSPGTPTRWPHAGSSSAVTGSGRASSTISQEA